MSLAGVWLALVTATATAPAGRRRNLGSWVVVQRYCRSWLAGACRTTGGDRNLRLKLILDASALDTAGRGVQSENEQGNLGGGQFLAVGLCCRMKCGRDSRLQSGRKSLSVNAEVRLANAMGPEPGLAPQSWRGGPVLARARRRGRLSRRRTALRPRQVVSVLEAGHLVLGRHFH